MPAFEPQTVSFDKLLLDPNNYRFQDDGNFQPVKEHRIAEDGVQRRSYNRMKESDRALPSLKDSILSNGFLPVDRIVARKIPNVEDKYLVLEGNRRVAALRWIAEDDKEGIEVPEKVLQDLQAIPILVALDGEVETGLYESIMGVRHVSGIKQWGGFQRARLIHVLASEKSIPIPDIAKKLGMRVQEVNRRYRAYKALLAMEDNDDYGEFAGAPLYPIFHEAVSLPRIREWLGWDGEAFANEQELTMFYEWITPQVVEEDSEEDPEPPKLNSHRDVRELPSILQNPEALSVLKDHDSTFADAIAIAKRGQAAKSWKAQVSSAIDALTGLSAIELPGLSTTEIAIIKKLGSVVSNVLVNYDKLTK